MQLAYGKLFGFDIRHAFFATPPDYLQLRPTPGCQALLQQLGARTRTNPGQLSVYVELDPQADPPVLRSAPGSDSLVFTFVISGGNPGLERVTGLPRYRPGREIFHFDNLRADIDGDDLYLGDSIAAARLGGPIRLFGDGIIRHRLANPATRTTLTVTDMFGATVSTRTFETAEPVSEVALDLSLIAPLRRGRYRLDDDSGGGLGFYFDPDLAGMDQLAVVDIYTHTSSLTATNRVPAAYRFLDGAAISERNYTLALPARETTWSYVVRKKHAANGIALTDLTLVSAIPFTRSVQGSEATFVSDAIVPLSQQRQGVALHKNGSVVLNLPNPDETTPLAGDAALGALESRIFVYV